MNHYTLDELVDIIETRHNENIKYAFIHESKLYEAQLEEIETKLNEVSLYFLSGDLKVILNADTVILSRFKNQYELVTNGEYIGSLSLESANAGQTRWNKKRQ